MVERCSHKANTKVRFFLATQDYISDYALVVEFGIHAGLRHPFPKKIRGSSPLRRTSETMIKLFIEFCRSCGFIVKSLTIRSDGKEHRIVDFEVTK